MRNTQGTNRRRDRGTTGAIALLILLTLPLCPFVPQSLGAIMLPELSESGVPQSQVQVLLRLFADSQARLKAIVLHPPGKTEAAKAYNLARASEQLRQIDQILLQLKAGSLAWANQAVPDAYRDGIALAEKQAREAVLGAHPGARGPVLGAGKTSDLQPPVSSPQFPAASFQLIDRRTAEVFARDIYLDLAKASDSIAANAKKALRDTRQEGLSEVEINRILAGGAIEGKPRQTIKSLREALEKVHGQQVTIIGKSGNPITFDTKYYASMVARTKTRQATVVARHDRLQQLGCDLVSIVGLISKNFCTAYLGQVYSLSGSSDKYPALSSLPGGGPPFHPNCSKSTRPFIEELASEKQLDLAEGDDDQDKMLNIDPATAQRRFKDLQLEPQVRANYASTATRLFGKVSG